MTSMQVHACACEDLRGLFDYIARVNSGKARSLLDSLLQMLLAPEALILQANPLKDEELMRYAFYYTNVELLNLFFTVQGDTIILRRVLLGRMQNEVLLR